MPLAKEIDYLTDYLELHQLRLAPYNQIVFSHEADNDWVLIEPLLLIHFVENAVKYGLHHEADSTVQIQLSAKTGVINFSTRNRLFINGLAIKSVDSGIGIQNVERRLALHYPHRHTLRIYQQGGQFCVDLRIDLNP